MNQEREGQGTRLSREGQKRKPKPGPPATLACREEQKERKKLGHPPQFRSLSEIDSNEVLYRDEKLDIMAL